ncbi:TetR/AcrR family transcriptional regulator [Nakamurella sp. GG22]
MIDETTGPPGRKPGRPRELRADRAIIDATLELFADEGYHALSMEAVAARAEVSKATIYRRWAGKQELVLDALATLNDDFPVAPDEHSDAPTRDVLLQALRHMAARDADSVAGRIMPRMMSYSLSHPQLYAEYLDRVVMPRRRWLYQALRRGIERGELRPDLDVQLAAVALVGPMLMYSHQSRPKPADDTVPERLMDIIWPGLTAPTMAPAGEPAEHQT